MLEKSIKLVACYFLCSIAFLCADNIPPETIYKQIKDINHPTVDDYRLIQKYLHNKDGGMLKPVGDATVDGVRSDFRIVGITPEDVPESGLIAVNCDANDRENCVLIYSSFNLNYPRGLRRLINLIKESDFKGHILYHLGGWPNVEQGDLTMAHIPYAFKVCTFREAKRLGFKRVFWLDTPIVPIASLNLMFHMISMKGYFVMSNWHNVGRFMNATAAAAFGLTLEQTQDIPSCSAGIFGVDFSNPKGAKIIETWYQKAMDKDAFYSARSDQNALSIILYQMGISDFVGMNTMPTHREQVQPDSLLFLDRNFVN